MVTLFYQGVLVENEKEREKMEITLRKSEYKRSRGKRRPRFDVA